MSTATSIKRARWAPLPQVREIMEKEYWESSEQ